MQNLAQGDPCCDFAFDDSASAISESSSNAPNDVNEYFRLCREIFLIKERISELTLDEAASVESMANSESATNLGYFEAKRKELNYALENVQQEMDAHREACLARGINPERFRHRRLSSRPSKNDNVAEWLNGNSET